MLKPVKTNLLLLSEKDWDKYAGPSHDDLWEPWADCTYDSGGEVVTVTAPDRLLLRPDAVSVVQHELRHGQLLAGGVPYNDENLARHHHAWWHLCIGVAHFFRLFGWWGNLHADGVTKAQARRLLVDRTGYVLVPAPVAPVAL